MKKLLALAVLSAFAAPAFAVATPIPTTDVLAQLAEINVFVLAVGIVMVGAAALAVAVKWGKATIFG